MWHYLITPWLRVLWTQAFLWALKHSAINCSCRRLWPSSLTVCKSSHSRHKSFNRLENASSSTESLGQLNKGSTTVNQRLGGKSTFQSVTQTQVQSVNSISSETSLVIMINVALIVEWHSLTTLLLGCYNVHRVVLTQTGQRFLWIIAAVVVTEQSSSTGRQATLADKLTHSVFIQKIK